MVGMGSFFGWCGASFVKALRAWFVASLLIAGIGAAMPACAYPLTYYFSGTIGTATVDGSFTLDIGGTLTNGLFATDFPATVSIDGQSMAAGGTTYLVDASPTPETVISFDFGQNSDEIEFIFGLASTSAVAPLVSFQSESVIIFDDVGGCPGDGNVCSFSLSAPAATTVPEPASVAPFATAVAMLAACLGMRRVWSTQRRSSSPL